jgi:hypothetical protein
MTAPDFLAHLRERGIRVRAVAGNLRLAPTDALTPEVLAEVRRLKPELLRLLAAPAGRTTTAECAWCGGGLAPYLCDLAGRPALLCPACKRWTYPDGRNA